MTAPSRRPLRQRFALRLARMALWPVAQLRPDSGWARIYRRLSEMEARRTSEPRPARRPPVSRPLLGFVLLVSAALVLWLRDVLRRPAPPAELPPAATHPVR